MKLSIALLATLVFVSTVSASTLKARTCEGGYVENKVESATLYKDSAENSYVEVTAHSTRKFIFAVSNKTEGIALMSLINSDAKSNVSILLVGDGFISSSNGGCIFNSDYRVSVQGL